MSEQTKIRRDGTYCCKAILDMRIDSFIEGFLDGYEKICGEKYLGSYDELLLSALKEFVKNRYILTTQAAEEAYMTVSEFKAKTGLKAQ